MRLLIYYIDFHWDNYQGGSGKIIEARYSLDVPKDMIISESEKYIKEKLLAHVEKQRPFRQDNPCSIVKVEIA